MQRLARVAVGNSACLLGIGAVLPIMRIMIRHRAKEGTVDWSLVLSSLAFGFSIYTLFRVERRERERELRQFLLESLRLSEAVIVGIHAYMSAFDAAMDETEDLHEALDEVYHRRTLETHVLPAGKDLMALQNPALRWRNEPFYPAFQRWVGSVEGVVHKAERGLSGMSLHNALREPMQVHSDYITEARRALTKP